MSKIGFNPNVAPVPPSPTPQDSKKPAGKASFASVLQEFVDDVNNLQQNADKAIEKLNTGEIKDVHQAVIAAEEADMAFRLMMEIRNKLLDAYQEVSRMQI